MGRKGPGVEVRDNSIRMQFTFDGEVLRRTLNVEGKPLPPTASNLRYAHRLAAEIRARIRFGSLYLAEYFPSAIKFWRAAVGGRRGSQMGDRPVRILKHSDVLTALASRPELTGKTVNNDVFVLRKAMAWRSPTARSLRTPSWPSPVPSVRRATRRLVR